MVYYFAYGSNMSSSQLKERCPSVSFVDVAELAEYRLAFTRFSVKRRCGVADIVPAAGQSVWGALFQIEEADMVELDRFEGANLSPPAYQRVNVIVRTPAGSEIAAITYEVVSKASADLQPSSDYHLLILNGAEHWGLPQDYRETLKKIKVS